MSVGGLPCCFLHQFGSFARQELYWASFLLDKHFSLFHILRMPLWSTPPSVGCLWCRWKRGGFLRSAVCPCFLNWSRTLSPSFKKIKGGFCSFFSSPFYFLLMLFSCQMNGLTRIFHGKHQWVMPTLGERQKRYKEHHNIFSVELLIWPWRLGEHSCWSLS